MNDFLWWMQWYHTVLRLHLLRFKMWLAMALMNLSIKIAEKVAEELDG